MMHIKTVKQIGNFQNTFKPACTKGFIIRGNYEWLELEEFKKFALAHPSYCCKKCLAKIQN
jgi:hypothetical protein